MLIKKLNFIRFKNFGKLTEILGWGGKIGGGVIPLPLPPSSVFPFTATPPPQRNVWFTVWEWGCSGAVERVQVGEFSGVGGGAQRGNR